MPIDHDGQYRPISSDQTDGGTSTFGSPNSVRIYRDMARGINNFAKYCGPNLCNDAWPGGILSPGDTSENVVLRMSSRYARVYEKFWCGASGAMADSNSYTCDVKIYVSTWPYLGPTVMDTDYLGEYDSCNIQFLNTVTRTASNSVTVDTGEDLVYLTATMTNNNASHRGYLYSLSCKATF